MFGFLPSPRSCRVCDTESLYRAHFCGLCNGLRQEYGLWARWLINRDSTFLALLGAAQVERPPGKECATCCNPWGEAHPLHQSGDTVRYAAAVTLCGLSGKLDDDADDERGSRRWLARGARHCLATPLASALGLLHAMAFPVREVRGWLAGQEGQERPGASLEEAAEATRMAFGEIVAHTAVVAGADQAEQRHWLREIGQSLGFLIYSKDAWDDWAADARRGRFNPLSHLPTEAQRRALLLPKLQAAAASIATAFDHLCLHRYQRLLRGILVGGVEQRIATWMSLPAPSLPPAPGPASPPPVPPPEVPEPNKPRPQRAMSERCAEAIGGCAELCCCRRGSSCAPRTRDCSRRCCEHCDCGCDVCECCGNGGCDGCDCGCGCDC